METIENVAQPNPMHSHLDPRKLGDIFIAVQQVKLMFCFENCLVYFVYLLCFVHFCPSFPIGGSIFWLLSCPTFLREVFHHLSRHLNDFEFQVVP